MGKVKDIVGKGASMRIKVRGPSSTRAASHNCKGRAKPGLRLLMEALLKGSLERKTEL
jgi:hypothetical protein